MENWASRLYAFFKHDAISWPHEFKLLHGVYAQLEALPLPKLQLLDVDKTLKQVFAQTQAQTPVDSMRFRSQFRRNLQKLLERYRE